MTSRERAKRLVELVASTGGVHLHFFSSTMEVLDHALGGDEPVAVVVDREQLAHQGRKITGRLIVFTADLVALAHFTGAAAGGSALADDDDEIGVDVYARSAITHVRLEHPGVARRSQNLIREEGGDALLPWGTRVHVTLNDITERLVIPEGTTSIPLDLLHAALLRDLTRR